jgi:hypothetical protein
VCTAAMQCMSTPCVGFFYRKKVTRYFTVNLLYCRGKRKPHGVF